jgi:hypothetical protein
MPKLRWAVLTAAAAILAYQLFVPPIVGLADQGDYYRTIGRFGYGPEDKSEPRVIAYVPRKFVPDPSFRVRSLEHVESEYIFVGAAMLLNKVVSKDGKLDILVIGLVHALAFLFAFSRLLTVTGGLRWTPLIWVAALFILTDVGYVAYWNSFYSEPASCIFLLLLLADSIAIARSGQLAPIELARWTLWVILFVGAKSQNFPFALLLAPLALRFGFWSKFRSARYVAIAGASLIVITAIFNFATAPRALTMANTYNVLFMAILPESKTPAADLAWFHLDPQLERYSGTGAWTPETAFGELFRRGILDHEVTPAAVARFWLLHPIRIWRRAKAVLPIAFSLRPEWCGNFDRSAGYYPGARSSAFSLWSQFHERVLIRFGKFLIVLLLLSPIAAIAAWFGNPTFRLRIECFGVLSACCLMAFLIGICGDSWDTVKHLYLFNLFLDVIAVCAITFLLSIVYSWRFRAKALASSNRT